MSIQYQTYNEKEITKSLLDSIEVDNRIKLNEDKKPMKVIGVSKNYILVIENIFGNIFYSVISKNRAKYRRNWVKKGKFYYGTDNWISGYKNQGHHWEDKEWLATYLESFESGETEITVRNSVNLEKIAIRK